MISKIPAVMQFNYSMSLYSKTNEHLTAYNKIMFYSFCVTLHVTLLSN